MRLLKRGARPGLDGPPADQGVELDPRHLPRRRLLPRRLSGSGPPGRPCPPTSRTSGSASACSTCSTTWPTGASKKYVLGEVDVFKIDHTHELYGHMNINYLRLDRVPQYDEGWQPVLDALRGRPVLRDDRRGPVARLHRRRPGRAARRSRSRPATARGARCRSSGPSRSGSPSWSRATATRVYRERIDLADTTPFGSAHPELHPDLTGRTWVRLEAWDVATNGAFTQPVWLNAEQSKSP